MNHLPVNYAEVETLYGELCNSKACSVALTSCQGGAGVTLVAVALAERAALDQRKVLLVDMNQAAPALHQQFGLKPQPWHFDNEQQWRQVVTPLNNGVDLLCATTIPESADFHSHQQLCNGLQQLQQHYDLVILDTSPLARRNRHNTPPELVCSSADAALLCVLSGVCTENQLLDANDRLKGARAHLLGVVMNDQYSPGLMAELIREARRLERFFPRIAQALARKLKRSLLLQQQL